MALTHCQRIVVVGAAGAGKSTFARQLGVLTHLPVVHMDRRYWLPNWTPPEPAEWFEAVERMVRAERWISDGNYSGTLHLRVQRCDAIVFFDFPRWLCFWGAFKRRYTWRAQRRPDIAEGCAEQLNLEFLMWIWRYPRASRIRVLNAIELAAPGVKLFTVKSRSDVRNLLASCAP
jgi:adenylate kinase family enzyme